MNLYAIRDRLIDYYMQPFAEHNDKAVLLGVSQAVNNLESNSAISKAPHHYEIWKLGYVTEDGHLVPEREFLADCSSLIRNSLREKSNGAPTVLERPMGGSESPPGGTSIAAGTQPSPAKDPP